MTQVVLNNAAISRFLTGVNGPVMRDLRRRGERVEGLARAAATGGVLNEKTGNLSGRLQTIAVLGAEPYIKIGSDWAKDDFSYGAYWDQHPERLSRGTTRRWLTDSLKDGLAN